MCVHVCACMRVCVCVSCMACVQTVPLMESNYLCGSDRDALGVKG